MRSEEDFVTEFYCPDEIVTENGGNAEVLYTVARFAYLNPYNKKSLITLFARALL